MKRKLYWHSDLYFAPSVRPLKRTLLYEMKYRKIPYGYYFVTLPEAEHDLFDIWSSEQIMRPWCSQSRVDVVGVAGSLSEAKELAGIMIWKTYKKTGGFDVRAYLGYR